ncbi:hypothetical protein [Pseudonocardia nigra]|uniref:hypothetical protein n=1 Tax=Pseudonocardia nigra TaxID=1921578 RepID=UPI001C5D731F|nr:hypothetical protein [Pseudonocardia nigra]
MSSPLSLRAGMSLGDLDLPELWVAYAGLGGALSESELEAALRGELPLSDHEHDVAQALNDRLVERGQDHPVPYTDELAERTGRTPRSRRG